MKLVRLQWRAVGLAVAVLALGVFFSRGYVWSYDGYVMRQVAESMVSHHSFRVADDPLGLSTPYASYGIGMSLFMAVCEVVGPMIGATPSQLDTLINPLMLVAIALTVWFLARARGAGPRLGAAVSLIVVLATPLLPYAATTFSELPTALGVALTLLGIELANRQPRLGGALVGMGAGLAALMRSDSLALVAPVVAIALFLTALDRRSAALAAALAAAPALGIVAAYNLLRYGSPVQTQYQDFPASDAWSHSIVSGIYGLVASPGRGLLVYAPIVLVLVLFWRPVWRRSPVLALTCAALVVDRVVVYAAWHGWHGGVAWGPRFLVPAMPALAPFIIEALRGAAAWRPAGTGRPAVRLALAGIAALIGLSVGIQMIGALTDPAKDRLMSSIHEREAVRPDGLTAGEWYASARYQRIWDDAIADWSLAPVVDHAGQVMRGRNLVDRFVSPVNPIGIVAAALVAGLGLAAALRREEADEAEPVDDASHLVGPRGYHADHADASEH